MDQSLPLAEQAEIDSNQSKDANNSGIPMSQIISYPPCTDLFPESGIPRIARIAWTTFGAFRWPVRILDRYAGSTYIPVTSLTCSASHVCVLFGGPRSFVLTSKPKACVFSHYDEYPPFVYKILDKYKSLYYYVSVTILNCTMICIL